MKQFWKRITDTENIGCFLIGGTCIGGCWLVYKVLAGAYHLLDKLINKL